MVKLQELSIKQVVGALGYYNSLPDDMLKWFTFTEFLGQLEKGIPWHKNAPLIWVHESKESMSGTVMTTIDHGFYYLYEHEEDKVLERFREVIK